MGSHETMIAERDITVDRQEVLNVQISEHAVEGFWRVQVRHPGSAREMSSTTVGGSDSFLWHLIQAAVDGEGAAWHQLASWGHGAMIRPRFGLRSS